MNPLGNNETKVFVSLLRNIVKKQGHPLWKTETKNRAAENSSLG